LTVVSEKRIIDLICSMRFLSRLARASYHGGLATLFESDERLA
jgi:hypothetical protein